MPEVSATTWYGAITVIVLGLVKLFLEVKAGNRTTERVLILTNGRMTAALASIARLSKALANQTNDLDDIKAAKLAEEELTKKYIQDEVAHK